MLGTNWVAPGDGNSLLELAEFVMSGERSLDITPLMRVEAVQHLAQLIQCKGLGPNWKTNLRIDESRVLKPYDLDRINSL